MTSASPETSNPGADARSAPGIDRHLRLPGTRNLRDVGGYPAGVDRRTRWRTLFRADALDRLPPRSVEALIGLGVRQVIDLRWPHELVTAPSVFADHPRVAYRHIALLDDDPTPAVGLAGTYRHIVDERADRLVEVIRALLRADGMPAVVGCAAGKDRTGVVIALLLATVGVPRSVIAADYELSAALYARPVDDEHLVDWRSEPIEVDSPPEYILGMLDHLDRRHGGPLGLLRAAGMLQAELDALVDRLTGPYSGTGWL